MTKWWTETEQAPRRPTGGRRGRHLREGDPAKAQDVEGWVVHLPSNRSSLVSNTFSKRIWGSWLKYRELEGELSISKSVNILSWEPLLLSWKKERRTKDIFCCNCHILKRKLFVKGQNLTEGQILDICLQHKDTQKSKQVKKKKKGRTVLVYGIWCWESEWD